MQNQVIKWDHKNNKFKVKRRKKMRHKIDKTIECTKGDLKAFESDIKCIWAKLQWIEREQIFSD